LQSLEGLEDFSHVWVIFIFHANTDMGGRRPGKGRVRVPRLGGARAGVLATRSPHRPSPIGACPSVCVPGFANHWSAS